MRRRKLEKELTAAYGTPPDVEYFPGDIEGIRTYAGHRAKLGLDAFTVDDTTWNDLSMDDVYKRLNGTHSTSGEQVLYHALRCPTVDAEAYEKRRTLIALMEAEPSLRLKLQVILARLGKRRAANTRAAFDPSPHGARGLFTALALSLGLIVCIIGIFFTKDFTIPLLLFLFGNPTYYYMVTHKLSRELDTVRYSISMIMACQRVKRLRHLALDEPLAPAYAALGRVRSIARWSGATFVVGSDLMMYVSIFFLLDLIQFEQTKRKLGRNHEDVFAIHEALGWLDASIAIASYRKSATGHCDPAIDFVPDAKPRLSLTDLAHPLLKNPTPNTVETGIPLLVTGSNASGKSTFLKAVTVNALLAQSICTACCGVYTATAFRIYSSMAIADSVLSGDSYFIAEIKSLKRILDAAARGERILCAIDEVLRGTNTVERIAASSEVLRALADAGALCLAATHDGELCAMLDGPFRLVHFEERIEGGEVLFDYQLKEGSATTRNAIRLLDILGFEKGIVARATEKAEEYQRTGAWQNADDAHD